MIEILCDDELPVRSVARNSPAQQAGVCYEERVTNWLLFYEHFYPQIGFRINGQLRIPDGLLYCKPDWLVIEVKTQFCHAAEQQLREYQAALAAWFRRPVKALLICREYRPELASLPVVASLAHSFSHSFSVLPLGTRSLATLGAVRNGLERDRERADTAVRASRSGGDTASELQRVSGLELA